ncbi:amidohydrolase/deacetylase family metallohydrolase [Acuticoccus mangrovi]|uniref:Amidohydrolase/deacetylase family metallohydrolase n=1 Tax=Acuticoccus mangrovi TaxID=2796142 RepID=A0A934IQ94_9HYPH|nr:amidohydrolase/deacetylase family metallohydrolase [Acuticoccus mangrovi]MBJ3775629.1 amidohydrolase/deacetylase family metallohydrolase [Acuticoccus mangrovi]
MATGSEPSAPITAVPGKIDLVITGGRVIDPANDIDGVMDVAIADGKIAAVGPNIHAPGAETIDATGAIVTPGLIDTHAHIFEHVSGDFGLNADLVGVRSGVTTLVDQGGASALTIEGFRQFIANQSTSRVLSFISAYLAGGLLGHRYVDLYGPTGINVDAVVKAARENADMVRGIKAHAEPGGYSRWGLESLKLAKQAGRELGLPVYVHLGTLWPEKDGATVDAAQILNEVVPLLDEGDILAHPFTRYPSGIVAPDGSIHPLVYEALERGVVMDVGRGAHFSFENAKAVVGAGLLPYTIGADLHGYNIRSADGGRWYKGMFTETDIVADEEDASPFATPFGLHHAMSELMAVGVSLHDVIKMTTSNAAKLLRLEDEIGALSPGMDADVSIFTVVPGEWHLVDANGVEQVAKELLRSDMAIRKGTPIAVDSPILPAFAKAA